MTAVQCKSGKPSVGQEGERRGFTLVEILVVIAIIGILSALVAVGVTKVIGNQRRSNTEGAMSTIQKTLMEHWAYVVAEAKKETGLAGILTNNPTTGAPGTIDGVFGADTTGGERNRVIWIKMRLMEAFPISFAEITASPSSPTSLFPYRNQTGATTGIIPAGMRRNIGTYKSALGTRTAAINAATESSACLLIALSVSRNGTALSVDNLGTANVADTDGDGINEFIDAWGKPLTFYRFPTDYKALQDSNPATGTAKAVKYADPADPGGALYNWASSTGKTKFITNVHPIISPFYSTAANMRACYILPTVVSSGPDGALGLSGNTPLATAMGISNAGQETDNLYSFKLRFGASQVSP